MIGAAGFKQKGWGTDNSDSLGEGHLYCDGVADAERAVGVCAGESGRAGVFKEVGVAIEIADEGVKVAIAVDVDKSGIGEVADRGQASEAGGSGESRTSGASGVLKEGGTAVVVAYKEIQIAIAIDIDKGGARVINRIINYLTRQTEAAKRGLD